MMLIAFGSAWPVSIYKSYKSKVNHGKSIFFLYIILFGYICGIIYQHLSTTQAQYVMYLFITNSVLVTIDIILFYRNKFLQTPKKYLAATVK